MSGQLTLPKKYLSYSALTLWKRDKRAFRRRYYEGIAMPDTPYTLFGREIAEELEKREALSHIPRYSVPEYKCEVEIDGVPVLGYLDSFDPDTNSIMEFKTGIKTPSGKPRWTKLEVAKHEQLPFYSMLVEEKHGKVDPVVTLVWLETAWVEREKTHFAEALDMMLSSTYRVLELTGHSETFTRRIAKWERDRMREWVRTASKEIAEDYAEYQKLSPPTPIVDSKNA